MNENLEKYIQNNKEEFNDLQPSNDIWERIQENLENREVPETGKHGELKRWILRVAAVLLISFVSISVYELITRANPENENQLAQARTVDPEIRELIEADAYYRHQISEKISELDRVAVGFTDIKQDVMADMAELDSAYSDLQQQLGEDIYKQEVVESMIQTYRIKLEILEDVLQQLKSVKESNSTKEVNI